MFNDIKDHVSPKRFSIVAYLCMIIYVQCGVYFTVMVKSVRDDEMERFSCPLDTNSLTLKQHIEKECFAMYDEFYNSPLRFSFFVPLSFGSLIVVSIVYYFFVTSRVDEIENFLNECKKSKTSTSKMNHRQDKNSFHIFKLYLGHLIARFVLGILFTILQQTLLYPSDFKTEFNCVYPRRPEANPNRTAAKNASVDSSNVTCKNFTALDKQFYGTIVFAFNMVYAVFALLEVFYLIYRQYSEHSWSCDSEFVVVYFLQQQYNREKSPFNEVVKDNSALTKSDIYRKKVLEASLTPDINYGPNTTIDEMFIDVVIQTGQAPHKFSKNMNRHEIYDAYMEVPEDSIRLEKIEDLFYPNRDTREKLPRTILALGRPGIGKTVLTTKIMRDWAKEVDGFYCDKIAFFFKFRWFNFEELQNLTLTEFLRFASELEKDEFESLLDEISNESKNVILIFDGFDEGVCNLQQFQNCLDRARKCSNEPDVSMSAMLLFIKLMLGLMLKDATILVTSRPSASEFYTKFTFSRIVEILGFTSEKIEKYVESFCVNNNSPNLKPEIWTYITSSSERMNLCYVPVNCFIVCVTLFNRLVDLTNENPLPTTLTKLYEEALVYFNKYHDRNEIDKDLKQLQDLAFFGIENDMLIFGGQLVNDKMEKSGLLHCLPSPSFQIQAQFCFIHLTMQEFLAAKHVVETSTPEKVKQFITCHFKDRKWQLVLQFLAGLLRRKMEKFDQYRCCVSSFTEHFVVKTDENDQVLCWLSCDNVLGMKCVSEMENEKIATEAATTSALKVVTRIFGPPECSLSPSDWTAVVFVCKYLKMLDTLWISGKENLDCLLEATKLLQERCIKKVSLKCSRIGDLGLQHVLNALTKSECHLAHEHSKLIELDLFMTDITDNGFMQLCQYLKKRGNGLQVLRVQSVNITSRGISTLSEALRNKVCSSLRVLDLSCTYFLDNGFCTLLRALKEKQYKLSKLSLGGCPFTSVENLVEFLCDEHCEITDLALYFSPIGDTGVSFLCMVFEMEKCMLAKLRLSECWLTHRCMPFLRQALRNGRCRLTYLDLSKNSIGNDGVIQLCEALKTEQCKLIELRLVKCELTDECMPFLGKALRDERCSLTKLNLGGNRICDNGVHKLCDALETEQLKLAELLLFKCALTGECMSSICGALRNGQCSFTYLDFSQNAIGDKGVVMLCKALKTKHCKLSVLSLSKCALTDECMPSLCEVLADEHCNLLNLHLTSNDFTEKHLPQLVDSLELEGCSLERLGISVGKFTEDRKQWLKRTEKSEYCKARGLKILLY